MTKQLVTLVPQVQSVVRGELTVRERIGTNPAMAASVSFPRHLGAKPTMPVDAMRGQSRAIRAGRPLGFAGVIVSSAAARCAGRAILSGWSRTGSSVSAEPTALPAAGRGEPGGPGYRQQELQQPCSMPTASVTRGM